MAWLWVIEKNIIFEYVPSQCPSPSLLHWWFLCESMGVSSQQITMLALASCRWHKLQRYGGREREPCFTRASQVTLVVRNLPASEGNKRDTGSISELRRSPGGGHGHPLQYSWLDNPMDREAWQVIVHGVARSQTQLNRLSMHTLLCKYFLQSGLFFL